MQRQSTSDGPLQDGRFLLLARIGRGGMADVFRAYDRLDGRLAALKVPHDDRPCGPGHPLTDEFSRWCGLRHPAVVRARELRVSSAGPISPGRPYLVLEHVECGPVHRVLRPGEIAPHVLLALAAQLLQALALLHARGWVHRDLKPANVLCESPDPLRIKLTDFGLASPTGRRGEPGNVSGSLPFIAPEALLGGRVDARTDLYGLGILLFQLATGALPAGPTVGDVLRWHLSSAPADAGDARPELPARLRRLIRRLTMRSPAARPADAATALALLGAGAETPALGDAGVPSSSRSSLRLALDETRLGSRRVVSLGCDSAGTRLRDELRGWLAAKGIAALTLAGGGVPTVVRLLDELLLAGGPGLRARARRMRLERHLPIQWLGEHLLPVAAAADELPDSEQRKIAAAVARLLRDPARARPAALFLEAHRGTAWAAAFVDELRRLQRGLGGAGRSPGGLLVVIPKCVARDQTCHCAR